MVISNLSVILTGACNFRCSYCYQDKNRHFLDGATARRAMDLFFPRFDAGATIHFYGGEPLLALESMRDVARDVAAKDRRRTKGIRYSVSTNGSLLDEGALEFFAANRFTVLLSFDGHAQDKGRQSGSYGAVLAALERLLSRPTIEVLTNSVFTPTTVGVLSSSMKTIVGRGVRDAQISFATDLPWNEDALAELEVQLADLRRFLLPLGKQRGVVPIGNFAASAGPGLFKCQAGEGRMALSPDGRLWGCHLFYDFHKKMRSAASSRFCFGTLDAFAARHATIYPRVLARYADLRMDCFHTPDRFCGLCDDLHVCAVCPVDAAFSSRIIGRITPTDCRIRTIVRREKWRFWKALDTAGLAVGSATFPSRRRASA